MCAPPVLNVYTQKTPLMWGYNVMQLIVIKSTYHPTNKKPATGRELFGFIFLPNFRLSIYSLSSVFVFLIISFY